MIRQQQIPKDLDKQAKEADLAGELTEAWEKMPPLPDKWIERLTEIRGWSKETIEKMDIRLQTYYRSKKTGNLVKIENPERIAIPIKDSDGQLVNIRLYKPKAQKMKIISWGKGFGTARLFPAAPQGDGTVILCEGEQDTLCAISKGFNAITQTSKLIKWPKEHLDPFRGRDVVIAYDADMPGIKYADAAAKALNKMAKSVRILTWPDYMGKLDNGNWPDSHGQDLTDFFIDHKRRPAELQELIDEAVPWQAGALDTGYWEFFDAGVSGRVSFKPKLLAKKIMKERSILADPESGLTYLWNGVVWEKYPAEQIEKMAVELLGDEAQRSRATDAAYQVKALSTIPHGRQLNDRQDWIGLKNCMFNLNTLEIRPHSKDFYCSIVLDVEYNSENPKACPRFLKYLNETIETKEAIMQAQEFAGYCLTRDTRFGKCLLLLGPGSDGKSIFINILRRLVGVENCSAISFQDLEDQFLRSTLYNKLLNISTEVGNKSLESQYFKAISTGDPISAAFKHENAFTFTPFCKLIFAGNKLPRVLDNSDGFFRRILPITFKHQFLENNPKTDPDLEEKLLKELSGIFTWAVVGWHRLKKQGRFTMCDETRNLLQKYRRLNNPILCFVEDRCQLGQDLYEDKNALYKEYSGYCGQFGYQRVNKENFFRELYAAKSFLRNCRPRDKNGSRTYKVKGIALAPSAE